MPTFTQAEGLCPAGVQTNSASRNVPNGNFSHVDATLSSTEWDAKAGTGTIEWGLEWSLDGTTWQRWLYGAPEPIGGRTRTGGMPFVSANAAGIAAIASGRVRLFAIPTVDIRIGAVITVS